jgi:hypothetical protein
MSRWTLGAKNGRRRGSPDAEDLGPDGDALENDLPDGPPWAFLDDEDGRDSPVLFVQPQIDPRVGKALRIEESLNLTRQLERLSFRGKAPILNRSSAAR